MTATEETDAVRVTNLIDGRNQPASDGALTERRDPADRRRVVAAAPDSTPLDAAAAVDAAESACITWATTPLERRAELIERALHLLEARSEELAILTVRESGKTLAECRSEVERSIATVRHQLEAAPAVAFREVFDEGGVRGCLERVPAGIAVVITPWNFPFSALLRKIVPALVMGDPVVAKPSELSPMSAFRIGEAFVQAGLPAGVLNIVHGRGATVGAALVQDPRVRAVSFTGSTGVGLSIAEAAGRRDLKVQLEMGGKNPLVVLADADLDRAVTDSVTGAFTAAGQWCVATSRIILEKPIAEEYTRRFLERVAAITVGPGLQPGVDMGALVSPQHHEKVERALRLAASEARVISGGSSITDGDLAHGEFVQPTVLADVTPGSSLLAEEIFGPVVALQTADSIDDAVRLADDTSYGLSASVYTSRRGSAQQFVDGLTTGKVAVNRPPNFGDARLSSSGRRDSGRGEGEGAESGLAFYTHEKAVFFTGELA